MRTRKIYSKLRYYRTRFGITQEIFAKLIGCQPTNYANKERGRVPWALVECEAIRDYINDKLTACGDKPVCIDDIFFADIVAVTQQKKKKHLTKAV